MKQSAQNGATLTENDEMSKLRQVYAPNYTVHPGQVLDELIRDRGISARELARRCGRSAKLIVQILSGKAPVEPQTALQFERVLDVDAKIWLNIEAAYQLHLATTAEGEELEEHAMWPERFPIKELQARGFIGPNKSKADSIRQLLKFFGVGSVQACDDRFDQLRAVSFRHSPSFESAQGALVAWLRIGELEAANIDCEEYDRSRFIEQLHHLRALTMHPIDHAIEEIKRRCSMAGVAFVITKPFKGVALSGVSRWISPRKALIQQTCRHMSDDHFWFTFFHEAAHLLLHSRKAMFVEGKDFVTDSPEEQEANEWAANFLIPEGAIVRFSASSKTTESEIKEFAFEHGIAPGIVVGQLQKRGVIKYGGPLEHLKQRFRWLDEN